MAAPHKQLFSVVRFTDLIANTIAFPAMNRWAIVSRPLKAD